jgi:putative FmdB family regulatory protein
MPIYEYRCERCEQLSEFFLRVSDPHPEACPRCGERGSLKKQISQTSFSLKGEGWYVTDYKKDKAPPNAAEKKPEPDGPEKSAEATKEGQSTPPAAGESVKAAPAATSPASTTSAAPAAASPAPAAAKKDS